MSKRVEIMFMVCCLTALSLTGVDQAAGEQGVVIETASGEADEEEVAEIARRLIAEHDLGDWMFTKRIVVDRTARTAHSHPVLTLNTRYIDDELEILTNIIHEQIHWFVLEDQQALGDTVAELREHYPDAPDGRPRGARDLDSTYLHLVVCSLEYMGLEEKIGRDAAEERLLIKPYYTWVFETVVEDRDYLRELLRRNDLLLP